MPADNGYVYIHLPASGRFVPAGILDITEDAGGVISTFRYGHRYLERTDAVPVDPLKLPLTTQAFQTIGLFGAFRDAGPDSWGRHLLDLAAEEYGIRPTEFDYLTVLDQYTRIGAVAFGPDLQGPRPHRPIWQRETGEGVGLDLAVMIKAVDAVLAGEKPALEFRPFLLRASSIGGEKPKVSVVYDGRFWIAKFSAHFDTWPTCRAELAAMCLARRCGIRVPRCQVISIGGRDIFLTERFDRFGDHPYRHRRHFVSAMTLTGSNETTKGSYGDIARAIRRFGPADTLQEDLSELFRRMLFNILCSNHDDHLKNHGFLFDTASRMWRLSPAYDLVPQPQREEEGNLRLALGVGEQGTAATIVNALSRTADFGLTRETAGKIFLEMAGIVRLHWREEHLKAGIPEEKFPVLSRSYRVAGIL